MHFRSKRRAMRHALYHTVSIASLIASAPAMAQQQQAAAASVEEIVVTGSRIKTNVTALNPVTIISAETIKQSKAVTVEDFLLKDPSIDFASGGSGQNSNNGGNGNSQASLHSLGAPRTLILLNGERLPFTDNQSTFAAVDLNNIPTAMIERVEVLRTGASSVYGADAVAGVINIITKKDFDGFRADGFIGGTTHGDGFEHSQSATMGTSNDRGNIMISLSHTDRSAVEQKDRSWATNLYLTESGGAGFPSSGRPPGLRLLGPPAGFGFQDYYGGTYDSFLVPGTTRFDLTKIPFLQGELETKQASMIGRYDITDNITAVTDVFYTNRSSHERLNPEPIDFLTTTLKYPNGFFLPAGTALNPSTVDIPARTRRFEGGPREYTSATNTYRIHAGLEGKIASDYDWQAGYIHGANDATYRIKGEVNFTRFFQLAGMVPCGADVAQGCHVADGRNGHGNLFSDNGLTADEVSYFQFINTRTSGYTLDYGYARFGGPIPIVKLPGGEPKFAAGIEHRRESLFDNPDSVIVNGDGNSNASPTAGSYTVTSGYLDVLLPIFKDQQFAKELNVEGSFRHDSYNIFGQATTWKASADYAPVEDIRFRGTRSTAFRAPQVKELFGGAFQNFATATDPCSTGGAAGLGDAAGSAACVAALTAAGANPATYQSSQTQITTINGGNTNLKPEKAKEYTVGLMATPRWLPGFSIGGDYYNIKINNYIQALATQDIMESCYFQNKPAFCTGISRQAGTGEITQVLAPNINFGTQHASGIDFESSYAFEARRIGINTSGEFNVNLHGTYEIHNYVTGASGVNDQAGAWQPSPAIIFEPKWRGSLAVTYAQDAWALNVTGRYYGPVHQLLGTIGDPGNDAPGIVYGDMAFTYNYKNYEFVVGMNNFMDKDPPFLNNFENNALQTYDYIGRFLFMRIGLKL